MEESDRRKLTDCILKKAAGYSATETQEEYSLVDGEMTLVKRKVTVKDVPPDIAALRLLLEDNRPEPVTREELERERKELTEKFFDIVKSQTKNKGEVNGTD